LVVADLAPGQSITNSTELFGAPQGTVAVKESTAPDGRPGIWVGHVHLASRDLRRSSEFYQGIGFRPVALLDDLAVLELRGGTHIVIKYDPQSSPTPSPFDLMVDDLPGTHRDWTERGLDVGPIRDQRVHLVFTVRDPDGHTISVYNSHVVGLV
jgi:catechol 2,3-dioxygenase-like lactoylglutathione lyase family enzyme